jgi:hypothetical protein
MLPAGTAKGKLMHGRWLVGTLVAAVLATAHVGAGHAAALPEHGYVTNSLNLPAVPDEAQSLGRDVDGDGEKDNQMGIVFATLAGAGLDLTGIMDAALTSGDIVMLHSLRATRLSNTKNATWQVWYGDPTTDPDLSGSGTFALPSDQPHSKRLDAKITDHVVRSAAGAVPLRLDLGAGAFELGMKRAKVVATCTKQGCSDGRIAGALTAHEVEDVLIPELAELFQAMVDADCPGPDADSCENGSSGQTVLGIFDENEDFTITLQEVQENSLIQTLLRPDLDLLEADGSPGHDGVEDFISFGFGFTTVKATLTRP